MDLDFSNFDELTVYQTSLRFDLVECYLSIFIDPTTLNSLNSDFFVKSKALSILPRHAFTLSLKIQHLSYLMTNSLLDKESFYWFQIWNSPPNKCPQISYLDVMRKENEIFEFLNFKETSQFLLVCFPCSSANHPLLPAKHGEWQRSAIYFWALYSLPWYLSNSLFQFLPFYRLIFSFLQSFCALAPKLIFHPILWIFSWQVCWLPKKFMSLFLSKGVLAQNGLLTNWPPPFLITSPYGHISSVEAFLLLACLARHILLSMSICQTLWLDIWVYVKPYWLHMLPLFQKPLLTSVSRRPPRLTSCSPSLRSIFNP